MKRWHAEQALMQKRWTEVLRDDRRWRTNYPTMEYRNASVERGGLGRMRKHRVFVGCGCSTCQWKKYEKGKIKKVQNDWQYEQLAGGWS